MAEKHVCACVRACVRVCVCAPSPAAPEGNCSPLPPVSYPTVALAAYWWPIVADTRWTMKEQRTCLAAVSSSLPSPTTTYVH